MAITIDDFSKIWASTSPLTPYTFSDDNYKDGWNFIGNTPPSRQMWDFLQKQNDEKLKYLLDNFNDYLPLAGGTMVGAIVGNPLTLTADDGNNSADMVLNADGSATLNAKNVECVDSYDKTNTNAYIRFESGLQLCWGRISSINTTDQTVNFPVPFIDTPRLGYTQNVTSTTVSVRTFTATGFLVVAGSGSNIGGSYVAMGFWK